MNQSVSNVSNSQLTGVNNSVTNTYNWNSVRKAKPSASNWFVFASLFVSAVALVLSIVAMCSIESHNFNADSTILSTLSILVATTVGIIAFLIGWQIWQTVDSNRHIAEVDKLKMSMKSNIITLITLNDENWRDVRSVVENYSAAIELAFNADDMESVCLAFARLEQYVEDKKGLLDFYEKDKKKYMRLFDKLEDNGFSTYRITCAFNNVEYEKS